MSARENHIQQGQELVTKATDEEKCQHFEEALKLYTQGIQHFILAIKSEGDCGEPSSSIRAKCSMYMDRAEEIKKSMADQDNATAASTDKSHDAGATNLETLEENIPDAVCIGKPTIKLENVAGLHAAKESLKEVFLPLKFPACFKGARMPWRGVLMFGAPGAGKTFLAEAAVSEVDNVTFFRVSASDIVCRWQAESERIVRRLFQLARERKPSVIFLDDIDMLCMSHSDGESESHRRVTTEFLVQMHDTSRANDDILVLSATSTPWTLDPVIRKRFEKRIYIPLPDEKARIEIFKMQMSRAQNELTEDYYLNLGSRSERYSGADIVSTARDAMMHPLRRVQAATHFKQVRGPSPLDKAVIMDDMLTPCSPGDPGALEMNWTSLPGGKLLVPVITMHDVTTSLSSTGPSIDDKYLQQLEAYAEEWAQ